MKNEFIASLLLLFIVLVGCTNQNITTNNVSNSINNVIEEDEYIDDNDIIIGLYKEFNSNHQRELITTYNGPWNQYTDIMSFVTFASLEETISGSTFQTIWYDYWNRYNSSNYKIGYYIYFTTTSGKVFEQTILSPGDGDWFFDYIQIYLYDDVHQQIGSWYSHITKEEMTDESILTSIKLTASTKIAEINSPIRLMVFTYDNDDFDENGYYRGNSKYEIIINKSN